ncbi:hypothetical protein Tco_0342738, partial [Tanacetum coccineum]
DELEKSRQQEASMGNTLHLFTKENERLRYELSWVMHEAIPRMIMKVVRSEEFDQKMLDVIIEEGRELGRREAQDFSPVIEALLIWIPV